MKFKVEKGTELFDKLVSVKDKMDKAQTAAEKLGKELGGEAVYSRRYINVAGGIDAIRFAYTTEPDKELWMKPDRHNSPRLFYPRSSKKANKQNQPIHDKIRALPVVTEDEYNDIIGFKYHWVGLRNYRTYNLFIYDTYAIIETGEGADYKPIEGMVEILESEYYKLKK